MRGFLQERVGPLLESVLRRFEASVSLEEHQALVAKIEAEAGTPGETPTFRADAGPPHGAEWQEDAEEVQRLAAHGEGLFGRLTRGELGAEEGDARLAEVAAVFAPRTWFLKRGVLFGTSPLLRALVAVADAPSARTRDYTRDVCDRFLRHLEVRRDGWLPFRACGRPRNACEELERIRFTHALLDASERFDDLRYLNAALKATDWNHAALERGLAGAHPVDLASARFLYAEGFRRQEALLERHFAELPTFSFGASDSPGEESAR